MNGNKKEYCIICLNCKKSRIVTYAQSWNIKKGKSSGRCPKCREGINISGLTKGQGWNKGITGKDSHSFGRTSEGLWGEDNPAWKGDDCSYFALHQWIYRQLGKARQCEYCGFVGRCHWANISKKYKRDVNDFISLCPFCHKKYDMGRLKL